MNENTLTSTVVTIVVTFVASGGFWNYVILRRKANTATTKLLMGLAYDRIMHLGLKYIEAGKITKDEYEDYRKYFYEPYKELGGNGTADRIMESIIALPIHSHDHIVHLKQERLNDGSE